ncbi:MAG: hypothetical protein ACNA8W_22210 [Bradymonadaceae bacterium]
MKSGITDKDIGFQDLLDVFDEMEDGVVVEVGVPADKGAFVYKAEDGVGGAPLILIASVNEFGSDDGRIPERSYLRSTIDENRDHFGEFLGKGLVKVMDGKWTPDQVMDALGMEAVNKVQRKIDNLKEPPNAEATIKRKGSSNPLVDTGQLKQSIIHRVRKGDE